MISPAFHEQVEERRWEQSYADERKEEMLTERAAELAKELPATFSAALSPFLQLSHFSSAMSKAVCSEAYEELVWAICMEQAKEEYDYRFLMGEEH